MQITKVARDLLAYRNLMRADIWIKGPYDLLGTKYPNYDNKRTRHLLLDFPQMLAWGRDRQAEEPTSVFIAFCE